VDVFIMGRQAELDAAAKLTGNSLTGVLGDVANREDVDRLYSTVKPEKGCLGRHHGWG